MSVFASWFAAPPPDAAVEIATDRVAVAVVGERSGGLVVQSYAAEPLPPGAVVASLTSSNIHNRAAVAVALRTAMDRAGARPRRVVNLFLGSADAPAGDWLVVHLRPEYTSIVIMRGAHVIFFRNRAEGDEAAIADLVHQSTMYYQDRLSGERFSRVFLGGGGRVPGAVETARRSLEERLGASVEPIDPRRA